MKQPQLQSPSLDNLRLVTVAEFARLAAASEETIRRRIRDGTIAAKRIGKGYGIPISTVEKLLT